MLTATDILRKVRTLEIKSKKLTSNMFTGEYHSAFKGRGMLYKEVREYAPGDDVRFIDWNVSARMGHPYSKIFEEERELTVMLLIDISGSTSVGTRVMTKRELATEIAAVLVFSAINNGDKVGVIFYSNIIEQYIPPKKGRDHALYIVRQLLTITPKGVGTHIAKALKYFLNLTRQKSIAFILSDLMDSGYDNELRLSAKKHDVIGVKLYEPFDMQLPRAGMLYIQDAESKKSKWIDTNNARVQSEFNQEFFRVTNYCTQLFQKAHCDLLHIRTDEDYVKVVQKFFISRNK